LPNTQENKPQKKTLFALQAIIRRGFHGERIVTGNKSKKRGG
jgi:hypothetical protein